MKSLPPNGLTLRLTPVAKPRQSQRDRWKKRPAVVRYRQYADQLRAMLRGYEVPQNGLHWIFDVPMPASWSKRKREAMRHTLHGSRPDIDNLLKGVLDALWPDGDSGVADVRATKRWADEGAIHILMLDPRP